MPCNTLSSLPGSIGAREHRGLGQFSGAAHSGPVYEHLSVRLRLLPGKYQQVAMKFAPSLHMAMATLHRSNHLLLILLNLVIVEPG